LISQANEWIALAKQRLKLRKRREKKNSSINSTELKKKKEDSC
jgi:hypothetical protein